MLVVFIMGYGVAFYSLIYGTTDFSWHLIRRIISVAFWQIFGDLEVLEIFESSRKKNEIKK